MSGPDRRAVVAALLATLGAAAGCTQAAEEADIVLVDARVYTLGWGEPDTEGRSAANAPRDSAGWHPNAEALAVKDGRIIFIGTSGEAGFYRGKKTRFVDLHGATVIPGLVDSHTHVGELGRNLSRVNLVGVKTEAEAVARIAERARQVPAGEWIVGYGWDEGAWAAHYPTLRLLSERVPSHPVYLRGLHGFAGWANRLGLTRAGITRASAAPVGGVIVKDAGGEPTGLVLNQAVPLLEQAVPAPTPAQLADQLLTALDTMAGRGYTAIHEAGVESAEMTALASLEKAGRLPIRVYAMLSVRDTVLARAWLARGPQRDSTRMLRVQAVKAFYDGALGSRGARLLADYSDSAGYRGVSGAGYGFDRKLVAALMRKGFQVAIHAIGDAGNREALDFIQSVEQRNPAVRNGRHRIEHAQVISPDDFTRFAELGVFPSMEPPHAVEDKGWAERRLGPVRIRGAYAWRTMRHYGARIPLNSDLPGSNFDFFYGYHAAVTRQDDRLQPPGGWHPEQRLTPDEALRGYTLWAAIASFSELYGGVIAPGRWADLTVVDLDLLNVAERHPDSLLTGKVMMTLANGKIIFERH